MSTSKVLAADWISRSSPLFQLITPPLARNRSAHESVAEPSAARSFVAGAERSGEVHARLPYCRGERHVDEPWSPRSG